MSDDSDGQPVDETITAVSGEWEFDAEVADSFDEHVRKSIPLYDELQRMIAELSEFFVRDGSVIYDLGCSTGNTLKSLHVKHEAKSDVSFFGVDVSDDMIEEARAKLNASDVQFLNQDILELAYSRRPDFVTCLFTLQFLDLEDRRRLLTRLYNQMREGAGLIVTEKIHAEDAQFEDMWLELYWEFKRRNDLSPQEILQKAGSIRGILKPMTLEENMTLFHQSGFDKVDTFFKWYNWAGFIAIKNPSADEGPAPAPQPDTEGNNVQQESTPEDPEV